MHKAQEEILMIIHANGLLLKEVADANNMSYQHLYYLLHTAKDISLDDYNCLQKYFEVHGYTLRATNSSADSIYRKALIFGCMTAERVAAVTREIARVEQHEELSYDEKQNIIHALDDAGECY